MHEVLPGLLKSTEFWATIFGALVGGIISLAIQMIAFWESRSIRKEDRKHQNKVLAHSLVFKSMRILSNVHVIHQHFGESDPQVLPDSVAVEPWQRYLPIANPPEPVNFSSDEMGMLLALRDTEVFNAMMDMDVRHNSIIATLKVFNSSRIALADAIGTMGVLDAEDGQQLSHMLSRGAVAQIRHKMIEVNILVEALQKISTADLEDAKRDISRLRDLLDKNILFTHKLELAPGV